jgi:hypothetical protein
LHDFGGKESTLVLGTLTGYRAWKIDNILLELIEEKPSWGRHSYLYSLNYITRWKVDKYKAACIKEKTNHAGDAPVSTCHCGIYGCHDPNVAETYTFLYNNAIRGAFQAWGKIILGTKGFRCQYARVCALTYHSIDIRTRAVIDHIASLYKVPVFDNYNMLKEKFPPSDISNLL